MTAPRRFAFGRYVLDLNRGSLWRDGVEVSIRPKSFDVLTYLVTHQGRLISKDELVAAAWPGAAVTDNSLAQCLSEIRRAIDDEAQTIIRTVPRRGYIFDAPVTIDDEQPLPAPVDGATPVLPSPASPARRSIRWTAGAAALVLLALVGAWSLWGGAGLRTSVPSGTPVQLTDFNDSAVSPALSHDGRMLAFVRGGFFGTVASPGGELYVKVLPDGPLMQLTRDGVTKDHPRFSPDDARIIYTTSSAGLGWNSSQVPALGGPPQPFLPNASGVAWLDKQRVVYSTIMSGAHMGIASSTESRSDYREIYFPSRLSGMAHRSSPSPDRTSLLVVEMNGGTWLPCRLLPMDGSTPGRAVGPLDGQCTSAAWSPDGRWMYFSSNAGGAFHVWRQRFPDGRPEQITFGPTEQEGTAVTPDGQYLITSMGLQQASLWLHDESGERKLTDERYVADPVVVPSGGSMLYIARTSSSRGQTSGELWSLDVDAGTKRAVLPGLVVSNYSLSPDGATIVFTSSVNGRNDGVWVADVARRTPPRRLVSGADLRAFFSGPDEIIYSGDDNRLHRMRADGSAATLASDERVEYLSTVSPDGRWAVVVGPHDGNGAGTVLRFLSLKGEESFDVCNEDCSVGPRSFLGAPPFVWSLDGQSMFVNLVHFGHTMARTAALPYRTDASAGALWPHGLRREKEIMSTPGATVINTALTFPAGKAGRYISWRASTQSNLYRVRLAP